MSQNKRKYDNISNNEEKSIVPMNTMGLFTFLRTYARRINEDDPKSLVETWDQALNRVITSCNTQLKVGFTKEENKELFNLLYNLKCSVAGRFLWQLGTKTVDLLGLPSLQNCAFIIINNPVESYMWSMNMLMLGAGIGFRILPEDLKDFPKVKYVLNTRKDTKDADFIVPDSREGWVKLLGKILKSHFYSGKSFTYSCMLLRSKGEPIKGFGGLASGSQILCDGMLKIEEILNKRANKNLRPIDALDIMNVIGMIVVSGNIRRSALIAIGDVNDKEYLNAKRWDIGNIPNYRAYSNNSVVCNDIKDIINNEEFWNNYKGNGEPYGLINLNLSRKCGRLNDFRYPDFDVEGFNPCAEQGLADAESCCLSDLFLPNITSKEELFTCAKYLYRICKHSLTLHCASSERTEQIVHKNMRMGIGISGYLQATEEQKSWLPDCYEYLRNFDEKYSIEHGFPKSVKLTTAKPSGCARKDMLILTNRGLLKLEEIGDVKGEQWQDIQNLSVYDDGIDKYGFSKQECRYVITRGIRKGEKCGKNICTTHKMVNDKIKNNCEPKLRQVNKFYVNGKVKTKKIITSDGLELESSLQHKYRIIDKNNEYVWKETKDLEKGDRLVVKLDDHPTDIKTPLKEIEIKKITNCQMMKQPKFLTSDIAWFIGLFYGDGSVHKRGIRISFNRKHPSEIKWLKDFFENTFGLSTVVDDDHSFYVNSAQFLKWLKINKILKEFCEDIEIPYLIRTANKENVISFIDGFWRADGGIHNASNGWSLCTISKIFAQQLLVLCRSVGCNVKLKCAEPSSKYGGFASKDRWIISVRDEKPENDRYRSFEFRNRKRDPFWLDPIVEIIDSECETFDIEVSDVHHYRMGGVISHNTLSILANVTPGVHPGFARYYKRRIRIASESSLINIAKKHGYEVEYARNFDGTNDHTTQIITFPFKLPDSTILAENCTAVQQLEYVKRLQTDWSDNSVSVTVYYRKHEIPEIKEWLLKNYNDSVKTVSFLLHTDHGFQQAPYEKITKEEYEEMIKVCKPISSVEGICFTPEKEEELAQTECVQGVCSFR